MSFLLATIPIALTALAVEAAAGYPARLFAAIGHPVTWIGALIDWLEARLNRPSKPKAVTRSLGVLALLITLATSVATAFGLTMACDGLFGGAAFVALGLLGNSLLAQRSLHDHVKQVAQGLSRDLEQGRVAISHIVGRDPQTLDRSAVARAAIESLAENFSDGIVAPTLYMVTGGLPGAVAYKTINTADSMIGHRTPRHEAYGWFAARLDDIVNLPASRIAALLIVLSAALLPGCRAREAAVSVWRHARHHRSPNAGWPEAAMAGALGLRLAGPRSYGGVVVADGWMGNGRSDAKPDDILAALRVYRLACALQAGVLGLLLLWLL